MTIRNYVIVNLAARPALYWNNRFGWVPLGSPNAFGAADRFSWDEKCCFHDRPHNSAWRNILTMRERK